MHLQQRKKPLKGGYAEASNGERARRDRKSVIVLKREAIGEVTYCLP